MLQIQDIPSPQRIKKKSSVKVALKQYNIRDHDFSLTNLGIFPLGFSKITTYMETAGSTA